MGELLASDSYVTMYVYSVAQNHSSNGVYGKFYFMCMYMLKPQFSKWHIITLTQTTGLK